MRHSAPLVTLVLMLFAANPLGAQQNTLPKYDSAGNLVSSGISAVPGNPTLGTNSNLGIGTSSPTAPLHIVSAGNGGNKLALFENSSGDGAGPVIVLSKNSPTPANGDISGYLIFWGNNSNGSRRDFGSITVKSDDVTAGAEASSVRLWNFVNGAELEVFTLKAGNLGLGTTSPNARLHVAGNVIVDGNIAAKFQDVAEWVDAAEPLPAGTVVAIDEDAINVVRRSQGSYELSVAGVISPQPGITLGEKGLGKALVAHTGRVQVKVDASYGAIRAGDLLVTSATPGYAMRSSPVDVAGVKMHRPGTVLGKALEPLANGKGEILVLLTLQ